MGQNPSSIGMSNSFPEALKKKAHSPAKRDNALRNNGFCTRPGCNENCFIELNGLVHPFCSRTCANLAAIFTTTAPRCSYPGCLKLAYVDPADGTQFQYCGRTCARTAAQIMPPIPKCARPMCKNSVHVDEKGVIFSHCGKTCSLAANNPSGPQCYRSGCGRKVYKDPLNPTKFHSYCSKKCYWLEGSTLSTTKLTLLDTDNIDYDIVHKKFISRLSNITIKAIFRLQMPKSIVDQHLNLKKTMSGSSTWGPNNVTRKMFHGTKYLCDPTILIQNKTPTCTTGCGMCGIIREGNRGIYSHYQQSKYLRMWFADDPQISLGYCGGNYGLKSMFMVDVLSPQAQNILIIADDAATLPKFLVIFQ
ncbi:hypothetical protein G9A89_001317 [Geosiphon pyriformis]|nr:hypothetical protein G9A89_001317 [Geosiphon pyriformis]